MLVYFTPSFVDPREVNLPLVAFNPWGKQRYVKNSAWHYCTSILYPLSSTSIRLMDKLFLLIGVTNIIYKKCVEVHRSEMYSHYLLKTLSRVSVGAGVFHP